MVKDFEKHTKTRVPKRGAPNAEYADFVARVSRGSDDANAEGSAEDTTKALVAVSPPPSANANANEAKKMRLSKDPSDPPDAGALLAHEEGDHLELDAVGGAELAALRLRFDLAHLARENRDDGGFVVSTRR